MMAASAMAKMIDLRNSNEDKSASIWMKAGETFEVLFDGQPGTGYEWINDIEFAKEQEGVRYRMGNGHVDFLNKDYDYRDPN